MSLNLSDDAALVLSLNLSDDGVHSISLVPIPSRRVSIIDPIRVHGQSRELLSENLQDRAFANEHTILPDVGMRGIDIGSIPASIDRSVRGHQATNGVRDHMNDARPMPHYMRPRLRDLQRETHQLPVTR